MNQLKAEMLQISALECKNCPMNIVGGPCAPVTNQIIQAAAKVEPLLLPSSFSEPEKRSQEALGMLESKLFGHACQAAGTIACSKQIEFYNKTTLDSIVNF